MRVPGTGTSVRSSRPRKTVKLFLCAFNRLTLSESSTGSPVPCIVFHVYKCIFIMISPPSLLLPSRPVKRLCLQFEFEFRLNEFSCVFFMTLDFFTDAGKFTTKLAIRFDWGLRERGEREGS